MREQKPSWLSRLRGFSASALDCIDRNGNVDGAFLISGTSADGSIGWLARGGALEVFSLSTGARIAAWCFGSVLKDLATCVTMVTEYHCDNSIKLLVATRTSSTNTGILCLFDVKASKVIKAVDIPYKVTSIEVVTSVGSASAPVHMLSDHLRHYCGIVAVGTHCGHIYLLDMCLDDEVGSDEVAPCGLTFLDPHAKDVASKRYNALQRGKHLCLELGEDSHCRGCYELRKPDNSTVRTYTADKVYVSCMMFSPQTGLLSVGFSFGCFQLWKLHIPVLEYTSRFEEDLYPVTKFAYQEPENDPRNFSYIWVCRGPDMADDIGDTTSNVALFQLGFDRKIWYDEFGFLFEELVSVGPRFEHDLTTDPFNASEVVECGSRVISCYTVKDHRYKVPDRSGNEESFDEGMTGQDLSLCAIVWEAETPDPHSRNPCYLALFDMNRWYHTQMPSTLRSSSYGSQVCPYLAFYSLEDVLQASNPDAIVALHLDHRSICKFHSPILPAPEQHFYPSSLAFAGVCVMETGVIQMRCLGIQRQILDDIQREGPSSLIDPNDLYNLCLYAGLLPRTFEQSTFSGASAVYRREALLSAILDHNLVGFIMTCIGQWASGEHAALGCTLKALLDWAWRKVTHIKGLLDRSCESLYDWSGLQFDEQTLQVLHHQQVALSHMVTIFQAISGQVVPTTEQGRQELETKLRVVTLVCQHLQMVLWFHSKGFLPECPEKVVVEKAFPYPADALAQAYNRRRTEIQKLHSELKPTDVLLIDGLLEISGTAIQTLWEKEGGSGLFPPPSLYATLNIYLVDNIPLRTKHIVVFYLLCEFLAMASEEQHSQLNEKLQQFCSTFSLPPGTSKFVQGIWLLDHKEFEDSLLYLLDPSVQSDICSSYHTRIVKAFLFQGRSKLALKYLRVKQPPMLTREDVKLRLTVLLANGLISEAFEFQRLCRDRLSSQDLLSHLFLGCQQTKTMAQLLQLPFSEEEEQQLVTFLKESKEPRVKELLVLYYLQRARLTEASRLNSRLHDTTHVLSVEDQERASIRNCIVEGYRRVMPAIQRKLADKPQRSAPSRPRNRREVTRPAPLSAFVNQSTKAQTITQATLIRAVLDKVHEMNPLATAEPEAAAELLQSPGTAVDGQSCATPFIGTPITPQLQRHRDTMEVVFPSSSSRSPTRVELSRMDSHPATSPVKSPYQLLSSPVRMDPTSLAQSFLGQHRPSKLHSAEALSLLQTPPIRRKTPGQSSRPPVEVTDTPQSILKSRHKAGLRQTVSMPNRLRPSLSVTVADITLPTPPQLAGKSQHVEMNEEASSQPETPKRLRFSEQPIGLESPEDGQGKETPLPETVHQSLKEAGELGAQSSLQLEPLPSLRAENVVNATVISDSSSESGKEIYDALDIEEEEGAVGAASKMGDEVQQHSPSPLHEDTEAVVLDDGSDEVSMATEEETLAEEAPTATEHFTDKISQWQQLLQECDVCREFERERSCVHLTQRPVDPQESKDKEERDDCEMHAEDEGEGGSNIDRQTADEMGKSENSAAEETTTSETEKLDIQTTEKTPESDNEVVDKGIDSDSESAVGESQEKRTAGKETEVIQTPKQTLLASEEVESKDAVDKKEVEAAVPMDAAVLTEALVPMEEENAASEEDSVSEPNGVVQLELSHENHEKLAMSDSDKEGERESNSFLEEESFVVGEPSLPKHCDKTARKSSEKNTKPGTVACTTLETTVAEAESENETPPVPHRVTRSSIVKKTTNVRSVIQRKSEVAAKDSNIDQVAKSSARTSLRGTGRNRKVGTRVSESSDASEVEKHGEELGVSAGVNKSPGRRLRSRKTEDRVSESAVEVSEEDKQGDNVNSTDPIKSPGRKGRSRKGELSPAVSTSSRRQSVRILAKEIHQRERRESDASNSSPGKTTPKENKGSTSGSPQVRTPPSKATRASVMPPTPPKSTTPESVSSHDALAPMETEQLLPRVRTSQSRSRSNSPAEDRHTELKVKRASRRSTRTSSASSSIAEENVTKAPAKTRKSYARTRSSVSPSGGESEKGETSATDDTDVESLSAVQHGPLSKGSFMLKLRSGRVSRETTPEPRGLSELESDEEVGRPKFTFSNPLAVEFNNDLDGGSQPGTPPPHSFVFSPPLTRSASKRRQSLSLVNKPISEMVLFSSDSEVTDGSPAKVPKKAEPTRKSLRKKVQPSDTPVKLLSPVPEESVLSSSPEKRQSRSTRSQTWAERYAKPKTRRLRISKQELNRVDKKL